MDYNGDTSSISTASSLSSVSVQNYPISVRRSIHFCKDHYLSVYRDSDLDLHKRSILDPVRQYCRRNRFNARSLLFKILPILQWLPRYQFKTDLVSDLISGCTVLALHIPQGLAYGHLAGAEPINGLYVSLFPVLIYAIFGTSRHISIGTFAVISIACKDVVESFQIGEENIPLFYHVHPNITKLDTGNPDEISNIDILITLSLLVGIIQLGLGFFRLGILSTLLSDTLISAFIVGSAFHVFTNQIFEFVGMESTKTEDYLLPIPAEFVHAWYNFFRRLPEKGHIPTVILSLSCCALLILCKYFLEPFIKKRFQLKRFTIPIDIFLVIIVTLVSALYEFDEKFGIRTIPNIPEGFKDMPKVPQIRHMSGMIPGAILVCLISYVITYSLGKMYAKQYQYKIDANQELIALGAANTVSSFFLCYPCCASLSRSAVQERVGGRTQMATIVSSFAMILILKFFSIYLRTLPKCVLSSIIMVAIYPTIRKILECRTAWKSSYLNGILWIVTFVLTLFFGVGHGLLYSIVFSFFTLIVSLVMPTIKLKYQVPGTDIFVEVEDNKYVNDRENFYNCLSGPEINRWIVFEFQGQLIFINVLIFRTKFYRMIASYIEEISPRSSKKFAREQSLDDTINKIENNQEIKHDGISVILDCSRLTNIDRKGVEALNETEDLLKRFHARLLLSGCSQLVYEKLEKFKFFDQFDRMNCYMTTIDAVKDIKG